MVSLTVSRFSSCRLVEQQQPIKCSIEIHNLHTHTPVDPCVRGTRHESRLDFLSLWLFFFLANHARCSSALNRYVLPNISLNFNWFTVREHIYCSSQIISAWYMHVQAGGRVRGWPHPPATVNCLGRPLPMFIVADFRKCWKLNYFCDNHHQLCGTRLQTPRAALTTLD